MSDTLVNRLRGIYGIGPDNEFGTRSFADFIPPISLEAVSRIEELNKALIALTSANSSWPMDVSDEDEELISRLIMLAEAG